MMPKAKISEVKLTDHQMVGELLASHHHVIGQLEGMLDAFSDSQYSVPPSDDISSIGMHVRHVIEFYQEVMRVRDNGEETSLCYDNRQRNLLLENSVDAARAALRHVRESMVTVAADTPLTLHVTLSAEQSMMAVQTTLMRELAYVLDHTIHHMAMMKMIASLCGIALGEGFGVAYATQAHRQQLQNA